MDHTDPFPEEELDSYHSPEPWTAEGRYIRDASGAIVVRGRSYADARRIAAAINATRDIPTDALERFKPLMDPEKGKGDSPVRTPRPPNSRSTSTRRIRGPRPTS